MHRQLIFCPNCNTLILDKPACPKCKWERSSVTPSSGEGKELWQFNAQAKVHSAPVVDGNLLFFSAENGDLFALDLKEQRAIWTITLEDGQPNETVAVWSDRVFYGEMTAREIGPYDKCLVAVDARTGEERWRFDTEAMNVSSPAVSLGTVYAVSSGKVLHAVDAVSGKERWRAAIASPWSPAAPLATTSMIYVPTRGNVLTAVDVQSGEERWTFTMRGWAPNTPALLDDVLYVSSWDNHLYALDATSGKLVWDFQADKYLISAPAVNREIVCVGCRDKNLYVIELATGKLIQRLKLGRVNGAPLIREGTIFAGSDDHKLYAYDAGKLELLWSFDVGSKIKSALAHRDDSLFVAARDGLVFEIQWRRTSRETAPETYEQQGDLEDAAIGYAQRGNYAKAGNLYEKLQCYPEAAALYLEGHDLEAAARNYELAGQIEPALAIWRELNRLDRVAELLEQTKRFAEAAPIVENQAQQAQSAGKAEEAKRLFAQAGELFEVAQQFAKAYDMYELAGDRDRSLLVASQLGDDSKAMALEKRGDWRAAADVLRGKDPIKAAELYVKQGGNENILQAIALYKEQGSRELLDKARELAQDAGAWLELADICRRLDDPAAEGRALERAAEDRELKPDAQRDGQAIAKLYDQAAEEFRRSAETDQQKNCERKARQFRKQPEVTLNINPSSDTYRQGEANIVNVLVTNAGFGPAFDIRLNVAGRFDMVSRGESIPGLKENASALRTLSVRPTDLPGPRVPLEVIADYHGKDDVEFREVQTAFYPVQTARPDRSTEVYNVYGGDVVRDYASKLSPKGDIVRGSKTGDIGYVRSFGQKRGKGKKETCPNCGEPVEREWQFCPNCQTILQRPQPSAASS